MAQSIIEFQGRIRADHRDRGAFVYVRQSTLKQVEEHTESGRRQYELVEWAESMGWPRERIQVIDEDQGKSSSTPEAREGFARLIKAVASGEVGIVIALEATRLARNNPDWHHLIYMSRWTKTLIADDRMVYDPELSADRAMLGIRGQMSEFEFDTSIKRMVEAQWCKARRGELLRIPPAGYEIDEDNHYVVTSDEAVAEAIRTAFAKFDELGTGRQVLVWWRKQGLKFPVRRIRRRAHRVVWAEATYRMIREVLRNPIFAGVYVYGKSQTVHVIDQEDPRRIRVLRRIRRNDSPVVIRDHHPAYIPFEKHQEILERMRGNYTMGKGPAREGVALLQGLVRCGRCGRAMYVGYGGHRSRLDRRTHQYRCVKLRNLTAEGGDCQTIGGKRVDETVVRAFLEVTQPAGIDAARLANEEARKQRDAADKNWKCQIEKAEYEVDRAARQYDAAEPENRLVARELERRWNERLRELEAMRAKAALVADQERFLTDDELDKMKFLCADLEGLWKAETTTNRDRKRLLRCLIEEVQLRTESDHYAVRVIWKGGALTDRTVNRVKGGAVNATPEETVELVRRLALEFDDTQIARILNRQGRRTGLGNPFTLGNVHSLRGSHYIPKCPRARVQDPREGPFTADQAARELGVSMNTIHLWLRHGLLAGEQATPGAPWRILLTEEVRKRVTVGQAPADWVGLTEAATRLSLSKSHVAYLVKTGKLPSVRTRIGKRLCWRIDVSSITSATQAGLFEQIGNPDSKEV